MGRLGRKATITKTTSFTVSNNNSKLAQAFDRVDWANTQVSEIQAQIESVSQEYQQAKVADRTASLIASSAASDSAAGRAIKARYIKKFGQVIADELPGYVVDPQVKKAIAPAIPLLSQVGSNDKDNSLANKLAQVVLTTAFDKVFNNAKLVDDADSGIPEVVECGVLYSELTEAIGREIELLARLRSYNEQDPKYFRTLFRKYLKDPLFGQSTAIKNVDNDASGNGLVWDSWSRATACKVGNYFLIKLCTIPLAFYRDDNGKSHKSPLFVTSLVRYDEKTTVAYVIPGLALTGNAAAVVQVAQQNAFFKAPLLIKPVPHSNEAVGGYHTDAALATQKLVRKVFHDLPVVLGEIPLAAINKLQDVAYTVNTFVLDNLDAIKAELIARANVANAVGSDYWVTPELGHYIPFVSGLSRKKIRKTYRTETVVTVAKRFAGRPFWHAWSFDYRGRLYPVSTVLTPQAPDFEKSLLKFHKPAEVTDRAKYWLKIQVANTFGKDKLPYSERVAWTEANTELITAVVTDPAGSIDRWKDASEPWQFLAACEEFYACVITGTRDTTNLPVAVDATCSGIQILAGITRDEAAAKLVNVVPDDVKHDAYGAVAARAAVLIQALDESLYAQIESVFDRKVVKSVVMTVPYNASSEKNTEQIRAALHEKRVYLSDPRSYSLIATCVKKALESELPGPLSFRKWLNAAAFQKAKTLNGAPLSWVSPSGFPVLQVKNKIEKITIDSLIGNTRKKTQLAVGYTNETNPKQHQTATAPNLIHSLDASILHIAISNLGDEQFTTIHDSVLGRATDLDTLQTQTRAAYSEIFSQDLLQQYAELFSVDTTKKNALPKLGNLNPEVVKQSDYFFC